MNKMKVFVILLAIVLLSGCQQGEVGSTDNTTVEQAVAGSVQ